MGKSAQSDLIHSMIQHLKAITEDLLQYSEHEQKAKVPPAEVPPPQLADSNDKSATQDNGLLVLASLMRYGRIYMSKSDEPTTQAKTGD